MNGMIYREIYREIKRRIASLVFGTSERSDEYQFINQHMKGDVVLDVGCCDSTFAYKLAKKGYEIVAIDVRKYVFRHQKLNFIRADARSLPFRDNLIDSCVCVSTIEHIGKSQYGIDSTDEHGDFVAMNEMMRVTKQGGRVLITTAWAKKYRDVPGFERYYDDATLDKLANEQVLLIKEYHAPLTKFWKHTFKWSKVSKEIAEERAFSLGSRPLVCLVYKKI